MSPEKLIVKIDSQVLNSMDLCWERYNLEFVQNWRVTTKPPAFARGGVIHKMVAHYRIGKKEGRTNLDQHGKLVEECSLVGRVAASATSMSMEEFEKDLVTFQAYILRWQYDGWEVLDVEEPFTKVLYDSDELQILYEGIIDARVIDPKIGQAIVDTKTESRKSYPFILSNQFQGYEWAFGVPVIVDKMGFQKTLADNERFRRQVHESGKPAIDEWVSDTINQVKEAIEHHRTGIFPKNRTSCDKYSGCLYQKVCALPAEIRGFKLQAYFQKTDPWDVYERDDVISKVDFDE